MSPWLAFFLGVPVGFVLTALLGAVSGNRKPFVRCCSCLNSGDRCELESGHSGPHHVVFRGYGPMGLGQDFYWPNHQQKAAAE